MKRNKGITLIALIVTVIIMIILAAVSIRIITSGGIIDKTREAAVDTIYQADYEEFLLAVTGARNYFLKDAKEYDGSENSINLDKVKETLEGWTDIKEDDTYVYATSPNGNTLKLAK